MLTSHNGIEWGLNTYCFDATFLQEISSALAPAKRIWDNRVRIKGSWQSKDHSLDEGSSLIAPLLNGASCLQDTPAIDSAADTPFAFENAR